MGSYKWEDELENAILESGVPLKIQNAAGQKFNLFGNVKWVHDSVHVKPDIRLDAGDAVVYIPHNITNFAIEDFLIIRNSMLKIAYLEKQFYRMDPDTENDLYYIVLFCQHPQNYQYQEEDDGYSITGDGVYYREWTDYNIGKLRLFDRVRIYDRYKREQSEPGQPGVIPGFVEYFEMARPWLIEPFNEDWLYGPEAQFAVFVEDFPQDWGALEPGELDWIVEFTEPFPQNWGELEPSTTTDFTELFPQDWGSLEPSTSTAFTEDFDSSW